MTILHLPLEEAVRQVRAGEIVNAADGHRPPARGRSAGRGPAVTAATASAPAPVAASCPSTPRSTSRGWRWSGAGRATPCAAYRRDLSAYVAWLDARSVALEDVTEADVERLRRPPPGGRPGAGVGGAGAGRGAQPPPLPGRGGADRRRPGRRGGGTAGAVRPAQAALGGGGHGPARRRRGQRAGAPPRPRHPRAAVRHRHAHQRAVRPGARRPRPGRGRRPGVRQGGQGAHRARRPSRARRRGRVAADRPGDPGWRPRAGPAAATPTRCS